MSYHEYYQNNPHESATMTLQEQEERLQFAMLEKFDELTGSDMLDFGLSYDEDAFLSVLKSMVIAKYDGNKEQVLTFATSLTSMILSKLEDYVEKEL